MSGRASKNPRGSGGCVLYPGTKVLCHSLKSASELNGQEGLCELWDPASGRMHVKLEKEVRALKPSNLSKVKVQSQQKAPEDEDPEMLRVLEIFQKYDSNGDGLLNRQEFTTCLKALGLGESCLETFLKSVDKDGDCEVQYDEFCEWALNPVGDKSKKHRVDVYWPDPLQAASKNTQIAGEDDEDLDETQELTVEDVTRICGGSLPDGWPSHGITVMNNMRSRFPDYPVEGIVWVMRRNNFVGGKVIAAIRATGAREVEVVPPSAVKIGLGNFPATYRVRSRDKPLPIYASTAQNWSFQNMRDAKMQAVGKVDTGADFTVLEVKRGSEYGFCFGRIEYRSRPCPCWVVLGLEIEGDNWALQDGARSARDLNYTEAERQG